MNDFRHITTKLSSEPSETNMSYLIKYINNHDINHSDVAFLATKMADSGIKISLYAQNGIDVASTGGPSSLSTLLVPIYLRVLNRVVPKLAVPGRPAGAIDTLATIPDYRIHLTPKEVTRCLIECGYVHFIADERYVPLDAMLFAYRQRIGAQQSIPLVIASILAKKSAVNLKEAGLDIRVGPYCNFGDSFNDARQNARYFCSVASLLGIKAVCILTDARKPYQPWVGRGESLAALNEIFNNKASYQLKSHAEQCWMMAVTVTNSAYDLKSPDGGKLKHIFGHNLVSQGSSLSAFEERIAEIINAHTIELVAKGNGYVVIQQNIVRSILVDVQKRFIGGRTEFPDPAGVRFLVEPGEYTKKGTPIASIRSPGQIEKSLISRLEDAIFVIEDSYHESFAERLQDEVVSNGR